MGRQKLLKIDPYELTKYEFYEFAPHTSRHVSTALALPGVRSAVTLIRLAFASRSWIRSSSFLLLFLPKSPDTSVLVRLPPARFRAAITLSASSSPMASPKMIFALFSAYRHMHKALCMFDSLITREPSPKANIIDSLKVMASALAVIAPSIPPRSVVRSSYASTHKSQASLPKLIRPGLKPASR